MDIMKCVVISSPISQNFIVDIVDLREELCLILKQILM